MHNGEDIFKQAPHVDFVCGSASYNALPALLDRVEAGETRVTGLDIDTDETFDAPQTERGNPYSAYVTIIEGCDKDCAYCVVPFTRGPERSRASRSIMAEARELAARGYTEITLLGQTGQQLPRPLRGGLELRRAARRGGATSRAFGGCASRRLIRATSPAISSRPSTAT